MSFEGIDWPFKGMKLSESEEVKEEGLCLSVLSYDKPHAPPVTTAAHSGTIVLSTAVKSSYSPSCFSFSISTINTTQKYSSLKQCVYIFSHL